VNPLKTKAIKLRKLGNSYKMISDEIGVSKSTLSNWLSRVPFEPNDEVIKRVGLAKLKSALYKQKLKFDSIKKANNHAKEDIRSLSDRDVFMLGIGLYMGEGEKSHENIRLVNSDPKIIKLSLKWLYKSCGLSKKNIRPVIHLYPDNSIKKVLSFWSKEIDIPISQFGKTIVDIRKNKTKLNRRKLPNGTLHLKVISNGDINLGVYLHRRIMSWMDNCIKQVRI